MYEKISIYKTAYDARIAPNSQKDTLAPIINAIGMSLNDTFGPAKDKINIVTEGISDYIYICMMSKELNIDTNKYEVASCPKCGFTAMHRYFGHLSSLQIKIADCDDKPGVQITDATIMQIYVAKMKMDYPKSL